MTATSSSRAATAAAWRWPLLLLLVHPSAGYAPPSAPNAASASNLKKRLQEDRQYLEVAPTQFKPEARPLPPSLLEATETNTHPADEDQSTLGRGVFITADWRRAWYTYQSPAEDLTLIDPWTGAAEYEITEDMIEGTVPDDLIGTMYRNGPGKFGVGEERVQHVLDSDGLVLSVDFGKPDAASNNKRAFTFRSRFVETEGFKAERDANAFVYRGTFGTAPRAFFDKTTGDGLNADPKEVSLASRVAANALKTKIKNSANTQVIAFGGKVLALFEAGLPHELDPVTLETIGEYDMGGTLGESSRLPVRLSADIPKELQPDFIGGSAHTAHPNVCPNTGNLVGWSWSQVVDDKSLEVTFTEWDSHEFSSVASTTHRIAGCELAPHDMCLTENCIMLKVNSLTMDQSSFIAGIKGPAASLAMDGQAPVTVHVFPRPTAKNQFEPFSVEVPACFSIHFSHGYEDNETGHLVSFFSGWPPSDSKDFLGAWGGFAPQFEVISPTYIWRLEIDPKTKKCVDLDIAPGASNACAEHPLVHPAFSTSPAKYVYAVGSNNVGDSTAPCGYVKLRVEDGKKEKLPIGEYNTEIDSYWFGARYFAGEPLIVPKRKNSDATCPTEYDEREAYLLGMVQDAVKDRSFVAIFDLEQDLSEGPVAKLYLKSAVPHGLHGCFTSDDGCSSVFC